MKTYVLTIENTAGGPGVTLYCALGALLALAAAALLIARRREER